MERALSRSQREKSASPEFTLEHVVPLVRDFPHRFEEVLELFVVETGEAADGAHVDFVLRLVDGERRIARRQKRQLEQPAVERFSARRRHAHDGREENQDAVIFEDVDTDRRRPFADLRVAGVVEPIDGGLGALAEAREVRVHHGARALVARAGVAVFVDGHEARGGFHDALERIAGALSRVVFRRARRPWRKKLARVALFAVWATASVGVLGCDGTRAGAAVDAGLDGDALAVAQARAALSAGAPAKLRADVLALAQTVEAMAQREGAGPRAVELHGLAARLYERTFRLEAREQDGKEAVSLARAASTDLAMPGACDLALLGARLSGELAHDASITYAEAFRIERRARALVAEPDLERDGGGVLAAATPTAAGACLLAARKLLGALAPFRPAPQILDAIEQGLAGEGQLVRAASRGGAASPDAPPHVLRIEQWPGKDTARVVVTLDKMARFRAGDDVLPGGGGGARTYVDLDGVDLGAGARDIAVDGMVTRLRSYTTTTGSRIALDLDGRGYRRVFFLPEPFRVVIDVARHPPVASARGKRNVTRVVLDPGHGGSDPGAIGSGGLREKDVTLDVAHRVAPILAKDGILVLLTRDDDRFVKLEERTARANAFEGDLFVSIHCNAAENHAHRGVETYVLDTANGDIAARVAARENATSAGAAADLGAILSTMRMADQATRSNKLAELLQRATVASLAPSYGDIPDSGVHTAGFYVLVGARMPSALFETSYISNPTDEERLGSEDFRKQLADAIANAIRAYREGR